MSNTDFHTCGACGREGEVRLDNRGARRCTFCWERVNSPIFIVNDAAADAVTPTEESAAADTKAAKKAKK